MENEQWRAVEGYETSYIISSTGRLKNIRTKKFLNPFTDKDGYFRVNLSENNRRSKRPIHRMVATAFLSNESNLPEVNHMNTNKKDNRVENLEWCTREYNLKHEHQNIKMRYPKGERNGMAKLNREKVIKIKELLASGMSQEKIGVLFGIGQANIWRIKHGHRWAHVHLEKQSQ